MARLGSDNRPPFLRSTSVAAPLGSAATLRIEKQFYVKNHWFSIDVENASVTEVMNIIVRQMQNYQWELRCGVVNIYPKNGRYPFFQDLLGTHLGRYSVQKGTPLGALRYFITATPEVRDFLARNHLKISEERRAFDGSTSTENISSSDITLKDLLNLIIKEKGGGWIVRRDKKHSTEGLEFVDVEI